jgi:hypothetical protein
MSSGQPMASSLVNENRLNSIHLSILGKCFSNNVTKVRKSYPLHNKKAEIHSIYQDLFQKSF